MLKKVLVSVCIHLNRNNTVTFIFANVCFSYISVHQRNISCMTTDYNCISYPTINRMTDKAENKELYFFLIYKNSETEINEVPFDFHSRVIERYLIMSYSL